MNSSPLHQCVSVSCNDSLCQAKRQRKVKFSPSVTVEYSTRFEGLKSDLWWTRRDFEIFTSKALRTAAEARKHFLLAEGLDQAVGFAKRIACLTDDQEDLVECLRSLQDEGRGLKLWCQYGYSRRGIEKHASRMYYEARRIDTRKLIKEVVALSKSGAPPELICESSVRISRSYTLLARMFGIADSKAAISQSPSIEVKVPRDNKSELNVSQRPNLALRSKLVLTRAN